MRVNGRVTVTAAGPINILTGLNGTQMAGYGKLARTMARAIVIQMRAGGTGAGVVMDGITGVQADGISPRIPSQNTPSDVSATLQSAASAGGGTNPGGTYSDNYVLPNGEGGIDVSIFWVDGTNPGDTINFSYDLIV